MSQRTAKKNRNGNYRGSYSKALQEAEKLELDEAYHIQGVDDEIALLRLKLRELVKEQPERIDLQLKAVNTIARLVKIRYQISKEQKKLA